MREEVIKGLILEYSYNLLYNNRKEIYELKDNYSIEYNRNVVKLNSEINRMKN